MVVCCTNCSDGFYSIRFYRKISLDRIGKKLMKKKRKGSAKYVYRGFCAVLLTLFAVGTFFVCWYYYIVQRVAVENAKWNGHLLGLGNLGMSLAIYAALYIIIGKGLHGFKIGVERTANVVASQVLTFFVIDAIEVPVSMAIAGNFRFFLKIVWPYLLLFLIQAVVSGILVFIMIHVYRRLFPPLGVLEIDGEYSNELSAKINSLKYKYHIEKKVSCKLGIEEIEKIIEDYDAVLINDVPATVENQVLKMCFDHDKRVYFVPKISDIIVKTSEELKLLDTPLFLCKNVGMNTFQRFVKRVLDILFSGVALIVLSPLLLITALAIKLNDGGPVFFRQERCTLYGKKFMILKFRSMIVDAEKDGRPHPAGEKDDRITKVGRVIRATRIDELPQILNILKGDMSIVGPRPERVENVELYTRYVPEFSFRAKVKGGLTGYAQVYGKYNTAALDKLKLDLMYIMNYSLLLDIQIVFETVKILFQKESTEGFSEGRIREMSDAAQINQEHEK